jgi:hypothetical protein
MRRAVAIGMCAGLGLSLACTIDRGGLAASVGARPDDAAADGEPFPSDAGRRADAGRRSDGACSDCSVPRDEDGDGLVADVDCDDGDPDVRDDAVRTCDRGCGLGTEVCTDGQWADCDAPAECTCAPGTSREVPCGLCGRRPQRCTFEGEWQDSGACASEGTCAVGSVEEQRQTCGACGTGSQRRTRTCSDSCEWGEWGSWGPCEGEAGCVPGTVATETESCGLCGFGTAERSRTCTDECQWGEWGLWSLCEGRQHCVAREGARYEVLCPGDTVELWCDQGPRLCTCPDGGGMVECIGNCRTGGP